MEAQTEKRLLMYLFRVDDDCHVKCPLSKGDLGNNLACIFRNNSVYVVRNSILINMS